MKIRKLISDLNRLIIKSYKEIKTNYSPCKEGIPTSDNRAFTAT